MSDGTDGSVTHMIGDLKQGDPEAARLLWARYFDRVVALARARIRGSGRGGADADEEDFALSAFHSLCAGAAAGRFGLLGDRDDLWQLLAVLTDRKVIDRRRREGRQRRGGGRVLDEAALDGGGTNPLQVLNEMAAAGDDPVFAEALAAECRCLIAGLNEGHRRVAQLRLEGYTGDEIANLLDRLFVIESPRG